MSRKIGMTALKLAFGALLASPLLLVGTACNPECVDKYDCLAKAHKGDAGFDDFQCVNNTCKAVPAQQTDTDGGI